MKHSFYIIAKVFEYQSDGRIARDYYGNAQTTHINVHIEAETLQEARSISSTIAKNTGHNWLEFTTCSEAERMWISGQPAFFDLKPLEGTKQLKGATL